MLVNVPKDAGGENILLKVSNLQFSYSNWDTIAAFQVITLHISDFRHFQTRGEREMNILDPVLDPVYVNLLKL
jgi:hypothetical protein